MKALTCGILSTLFQLKFRQLLWCNSDFKISDRFCFIGFTNLFISAIGISVKSHIGAPLLYRQKQVNVLSSKNQVLRKLNHRYVTGYNIIVKYCLDKMANQIET